MSCTQFIFHSEFIKAALFAEEDGDILSDGECDDVSERACDRSTCAHGSVSSTSVTTTSSSVRTAHE